MLRQIFFIHELIVAAVVVFSGWGLVHRTTTQLAVYPTASLLQPFFFYGQMEYLVQHSVRP